MRPGAAGRQGEPVADEVLHLNRRLPLTTRFVATTTVVVVVVAAVLSWVTVRTIQAWELERATDEARQLAELVVLPTVDASLLAAASTSGSSVGADVAATVERAAAASGGAVVVRTLAGVAVVSGGRPQTSGPVPVGLPTSLGDAGSVTVVDGTLVHVGVPVRDDTGTTVGDVVVTVPVAPGLSTVRTQVAIEVAVVFAGLLVVLLGLRRWMRAASDALDRAESVNEHVSRHDDLTGLPNRAQLVDRIIAALEGRDGSADLTALLLLDLDRFKQVNDALGHHNGDLLLEQVAERLGGAIHRSDVLARLGGDEFAVLLPEIRDVEAAHRTGERLARSLDAPFTVAGVEVTISTSVGISVAPLDAHDATDLLRHADMAMYAAKRAGVEVAAYESDGSDHLDVDRLSLLGGLRRAIEEDELVLHYQPQLHLESGRIAGVEALIRWQHPSKGLLGPWAFIDLAEQSGLMGPMTMWVLESAANQLRLWDEAGIDLSIAINVSPRTIVEPGFAGRIFTSLARWGVDPTRLELEITEHELVEEAELVAETLARIRSLGVRVAIDDFGTGYSSLSYLTALPVDVLKIDRSLVASFEQDEGQSTVLRALSDLAHDLDMAVVAEGVEQYDTLTALHRLGVDLAQGYALWKPAPADVVTGLLLGSGDPPPPPTDGEGRAPGPRDQETSGRPPHEDATAG